MSQLMTTPTKAPPSTKPLTMGEMVLAKRDSIEAIVNKCISAESIIRSAMLAINNNPKLSECTAMSVIGSVMTAARLGLELNTPLGFAYMIPRKISVKDANGNWNKVPTCTILVGYRGFLAMIHRSRQVECVDSFVVYKGDEFDIGYGSKPYVYHKPNFDADRSDANITGAYAICLMKQARRPQFEYMPIADLRKVAAVGGGDSDAYKNWLSEMYRKAPLRRGAKWWPLSSDVAASLAEADAVERGERIVDTTATETPPKPRPAIQSVIDDLPMGEDDAPLLTSGKDFDPDEISAAMNTQRTP